MTILGMPLSMFLVFVATIVAGSLGAIHFVVVHLVLRRPFEDEVAPPAPGGSRRSRGPDSGSKPGEDR